MAPGVERTGVFAFALTRLAFDDAGRAHTPDGDADSGVVLGTWSAGQSTQVYLDALFSGGPSNAPAILFESTVGNAAASLAGMEFKLRGPNVTISHKEASSLAAITSAVDMLRMGRATGLVAGGVDVVYEVFFKAHDGFRVMSAHGAHSGALAPFDAARAGFVLVKVVWACGSSRPTPYRRARTLRGMARSSAWGSPVLPCPCTTGPIRRSRWRGPCGWHSTMQD